MPDKPIEEETSQADAGFVAPSGDEATQPTPDQDLAENQKEKTKGEQYIERFYHPHLELPEEMPEEIRTDLGNYSPQNASGLWRSMRSGFGGLVTPGLIWGQTAEYISGLLKGEDVVMAAAPGTRSGNIRHAFVHMNLLSESLPAGLPNLGSPDLNPVDVLSFLKEYIDDLPKVEESYSQIIQRVKSKKGDFKERVGDYIKLLGDLDDVLHAYGKTMDESSLHEAIQIAKEIQDITGIPWFINIVKEKLDFSVDDLNLEGTDRHICEDVQRKLQEDGAGGGYLITGGTFEKSLDARRRKVKEYLDRIESAKF